MPVDLFSDPQPARTEPRVLSVTEVTRAVRSALEQGIGQVWVEGEVSNYRKQASGHQYFTLKDEQCQVQCVMFARTGMWRRETVPLSDGMCVQVRGVLTVYEARGQYQINVQMVQASGAGLLQAKFEALKRKLDVEGLFDPDRKKPLPQFATTLAIVTSPTGAALRDMLNILARRAPWIRVLISPVRVQGDGAAEEIAAAVEDLDRHSSLGLPTPDVIVVARGGGSAEDLWEFNEEIVARAIAASSIPVVSAVGHEIDFTISDFVADLRAPTPSAAAELVAPDTAELKRRLQQRAAQIRRCLVATIEQQKHRLNGMARSGLFREPRNRLNEAAQRTDSAAEALQRALRERVVSERQRVASLLAAVKQHRPDQLLELRRHELTVHAGKLSHALQQGLAAHTQKLQRLGSLLRLLSPEATLERGYTLSTNAQGELLTSAQSIAPGDRILTRFSDGTVQSEVIVPE